MQSMRGYLAGFAATALFSLAPLAAHADVAIHVDQVVPPQGESCAVLGATEIMPYIYDGALHSFDVTVSDPSYVVLSAEVGGASVPFSQVSRWFDQAQGVRMHVDIESRYLLNDTPITVTLMSAHSGPQGATCIATITSVVPAVSGAAIPAGPAAPSEPQPTVHAPQTQAGYPWSHITYGSKPKPAAPVPVKPATSSATSAPALVTAIHSLGDLCTAQSGPAKLWIVLLVLYAIFVWFLVSQKRGAGESRDWSVALVVAAFLGLLFFWYISAACRTGSWAPILATIIACAGLIALTQSEGKGTDLLLLEDPKH